MSVEWINPMVEKKVSVWLRTQEKLQSEERQYEKEPVRMVYVEESFAKK